jgi:threonine dehydrogenase-like Zn-dependent dehydrogenase
MKAVVFEGGVARLRNDYPLPHRKPGEALIKVLVAGVCNTDLEILRGYMGFSGVPGHEFVGVVEEADSRALVGRRVVGEINCPCGACRFCKMGLGHHCRSRTVLGIQGRDGAFAEYLTLPEANLHSLSDEIPDETAVFAEPTAAAFRILEQVSLKRTDRCIVLGDGKLGLLVAQVLAPKSTPTLLGHNRRKIEVAQSLGIAARLEEGFDERDFDVAVDCTGSAAGFKAALALLRPQGTLVAKTTVAGDVPAPTWMVVVDEITVVGSRCGPFKPALEALQSGTVKVAPLICARYALDDFEAAFAKAREKDVFKVLFYPTGDSWKETDTSS